MATLVYGAYEPEELINAELSKSKTWPERKAHTIDVIKNADRDLKLLSCADKLANIRDIIRDYDRLGGWCVGYLLCWMLLVMGISDMPAFKEFGTCVGEMFGDAKV